ncbi:hypothetical protein BCV72DRAFT_318120 [Rhizopus microsporus var. microsporus]|uniref:Uncharacterized protein n=1 Tax=Rhizopus microsporus var. microsporus TaxID=86635 RepID=A0A1X0RIN7_RHIZD|nr:hypothetical protein BCV72DRAFT_318120 [Rhizopus microsporus var. microsporus]
MGKAKRKRMGQAEKIENKKEKKKAKYDHNDEQEKDIVCTSCHQKGHKNAKSSLCPNRKLIKQEELQQLMGNRKTTTVKTKLETILRPAHRNIKDKIIKVSKDIRNILVRAQLFVNYYIMTHNGLVVDKKVFTQNFWYSISQLVLGKTPTNKKLLPGDIFSSWGSFSSRYKEIVYRMDNPVAGYSQCLTAACVEVATCYNNMIVECF